MGSKRISLGAAIAYMAIVAAVTFSLTMIYSLNIFNQKIKNMDQREEMYNKISEIDRYVRDSFYREIDEEKLQVSSAAGYIAGLDDPYAKYMTAKEYATYLSQTDAERYVGIGVRTELNADGYIRLKEVYPESPAELVGLAAGDLIISVDEVTATAANYEELVSGFQGEVGSKISLVVRKDNNDTSVEVTRRTIDIPTVRVQKIDTVAYLRFNAVNTWTPAQFEKILKQQLNDGATGLIFDLRDVSSDNMKQVCDMLSSLLPRGTIAFAEYRNGNVEEVAVADEEAVNLPMVVLVDKTTTGAVEMFAQALKDYNAAKIVGENTFGKGTMQEVKKLSDGSAVMITTALYTGPAGDSYDGTGVAPDYLVPLGGAPEDRDLMIGNLETDGQLRKAMEIATSAMRAESQS